MERQSRRNGISSLVQEEAIMSEVVHLADQLILLTGAGSISGLLIKYIATKIEKTSNSFNVLLAKLNNYIDVAQRDIEDRKVLYPLELMHYRLAEEMSEDIKEILRKK